MKIIFLVLIILFNLGSVYSQESTKAIYYPKPDLKKFEGTWEYEHQGEKFIINLKMEKLTKEEFTMDFLQGYYTHIKDGIVLANAVDQTKKTIAVGTFADSTNKIKFLFKDLVKDKLGEATMELEGNNRDVALWKLTNTEGIRVGKYDYSFSVPLKAVLKRIN